MKGDVVAAVRGGNKVAVVVGCNYPNDTTGGRLHQCQNDAVAMHKVFGFKPNSIKLLLDKPGNTASMPSGARIKRELCSMIDGARPGDVLFFFSGHEVQAFGRPEHGAIYATDSNIITRIDFRYMVDRVRRGASFTIMADSYYSGELIDKEPVQVRLRPGMADSYYTLPLLPQPKPALAPDQGILLSACQPNETSGECFRDNRREK